MTKDTKNIVIAILVVALIAVTCLWIKDRRNSDPLKNLSIQLDEHKSKVESACSSMEAEGAKASCDVALSELKTFLSQLDKLSN